MRVDGLATVYDDALTGAECIFNGKEICPSCDFFHSSPSLERSLFHYLVPERRIVDHAVVQRGEDSARVEAVACSSEGRNPQGYILRVCYDSTLAGAIFGEFCSGMSAGRSDIEYGPDAFLNAVFLGNADKSLEIGVDVPFVLRAGIVDEDLYIIDVRVPFVVPDIDLEMSI